MKFKIKDLVIGVMNPADISTIQCDCFGQSITKLPECGDNISFVNWSQLLDALPDTLRKQLTDELGKPNETITEPKSRQAAEDLEGRLEGALAEVRKIKKGFDAP